VKLIHLLNIRLNRHGILKTMILTPTLPISVIIPNLHSPIIDKVVDAVLRQDFGGEFEIIVVGQDNYHLLSGCKDKRLSCIQIKNAGNPSIARNIGIKRARGKILFFLDADCLVPRTWMRTLFLNHHKDKPMVVGGSFSLELGKSDNHWQFCDNFIHFYIIDSRRPKGIVRDLFTANLSMPRIIIEKIGMFNEHLVTGEDKEYCFRVMQAGYPLLFEPKAQAIHRSSRMRFCSILQHSYSWGLNSLKVRLKYAHMEKVPVYMTSAFSLFLMTVPIAFGTTVKIYMTHPFYLRYVHIFHIIFLSKMFWCFGALTYLKKIHA
jgi:glycosyltransferase involved in cell wall biosynthesis